MTFATFCFHSVNRQGRSELRSSGRSVSPSPIRYHSPGGLATHLSQKVTHKSSKEAVGLKLSNLTPPGSRKYGTYAMGGNYERSDSSHSSPCRSPCSSSNYHKTSVNSAVKNTAPSSARKGQLGVNPTRPICTSGKETFDLILIHCEVWRRLPSNLFEVE